MDKEEVHQAELRTCWHCADLSSGETLAVMYCLFTGSVITHLAVMFCLLNGSNTWISIHTYNYVLDCYVELLSSKYLLC